MGVACAAAAARCPPSHVAHPHPCCPGASAATCRGQAIALATLTNFGSNFLVSLLLPSIQEQIGQGGELTEVEPPAAACSPGLRRHRRLPRPHAAAFPSGHACAAVAFRPFHRNTVHISPARPAAATYFAFASIGLVAVATINAIVPETKVGRNGSSHAIEAAAPHLQACQRPRSQPCPCTAQPPACRISCAAAAQIMLPAWLIELEKLTQPFCT